MEKSVPMQPCLMFHKAQRGEVESTVQSNDASNHMYICLPGGFVKEHDRWVVDEFECDGETFALAT